MLKIDIFNHILPLKYKEALSKIAPSSPQLKIAAVLPTIYDLDHRFRLTDKFDGYIQVPTMNANFDEIADSEKAIDLAKLANDSLAELILKYPDRFIAGVACLPMNNMDAALREVDRAINDLKLRGVEVLTPSNGKPLDSPEFLPLYEKMSQYNLPILIHPMRSSDRADYKMEQKSLFSIHHVLGLPYETSVAMFRLVFSGILEKYPNLKIVTHHCGAMIPYFRERITIGFDRREMQMGDKSKQGLTKPLLDYFKMFYNDTAINGNTSGLMCAYDFCGADHILFGTDFPPDNQNGLRKLREVIASVEQMNITDLEKRKIFEDNARNLFRLPI